MELKLRYAGVQVTKVLQGMRWQIKRPKWQLKNPKAVELSGGTRYSDQYEGKKCHCQCPWLTLNGVSRRLFLFCHYSHATYLGHGGNVSQRRSGGKARAGGIPSDKQKV